MPSTHIVLHGAGFGSSRGIDLLLKGIRHIRTALNGDAGQHKQLFNVLFYLYFSVCGLVSDLLQSII